MRDASERWIFALTTCSAAAVLVSIAAAQTLLVTTIVVWIITRPGKLRLPSYFLPLGVFLAGTLLATAFSADPARGVWAIRKFWLFSMGVLAANFVTTEWRARTAQRILIGVAGATSLVGIVQFALKYRKFLETEELRYDPMILSRITGSLGHWMTFSGVQLLVWCAAIPALIVLARPWLAPISAVAAAIVLGNTRSVWLGAIAGPGAVAIALPRKVLVQGIAPLILISVAASPFIYHRIAASFGNQFRPDTSRLVMLDVGARMIREHPLVGVGPERIHDEFPRYYRGEEPLETAVPYYGHLHNNVLQIAAERGLLCLTAFFWFIFELYRSLIRVWKTADVSTRWVALSALSALTGFIVSGFGEYNFGDSEVLLLLLFIVSAPLGLNRINVQENPHR